MTRPRITRRRLLSIAAATCATSALGASPIARWSGSALGTVAEVRLAGLHHDDAVPIFARIEAELSRIDAIFSLYRTDSALMRLNRDGYLVSPPPEMLELLSLCRMIHDLTEGVFDPTVQPLFALHAAHAADGTMPGPDAIASARGMVGLDRVAFGTESVRFLRPGIGLTFNGVAQGMATDRIAGLLARDGFRDVMVNAGEIRVGDGGWRLRLPDGSMRVVSRGAVATSHRLATIIGPGIGHIFDPTGAAQTRRDAPVTAFHESAAVADAASTAAVFMAGGQLSPLRRIGVEFTAA